MVIEVNRSPPAVIVNGFSITTAPPIAALLAVIGHPTRIDTGPTRAPYGFRNNQLHVFDSLGVHVNEHHHTRRAEALGITLSVAEPRYRFTPSSTYTGRLKFDGVDMPLEADEREFLQKCPWSAEESLGTWICRFDEFSVLWDAVGPKLAGGRRSKRRIVVSVSLSWPHDSHGEPA